MQNKRISIIAITWCVLVLFVAPFVVQGQGAVTPTPPLMATVEAVETSHQIYLPLIFKTGEVRPNFTAAAHSLVGSVPFTATFVNETGTPEDFTFNWRFGDGTELTTSAVTVTHIFTQEGLYDVFLTMVDNKGVGHILTQTNYVTVLPPATEPAGLLFEENVGQFDPQVKFVVRGSQGGTLFLTEAGLWLSVRRPVSTDRPEWRRMVDRMNHKTSWKGTDLRLSFPGANPQPRLEPFNRVETSVSYLQGNKPDEWQVASPVWQGVRYVNLYPGVDLELTSEKGQLRQRWVERDPEGRAAQGLSLAAAEEASLRVEGAETIELEGDHLRLNTPIGTLSWPLLERVAGDGSPLPPPGPASQIPASQISANQTNEQEIFRPFAATAEERSEGLASLEETPVSALLYSSYLGNADDNWGGLIALDGEQNIYTAISIITPQLPITPGILGPGGESDILLVKIDPGQSTPAYLVYLGGTAGDWASAMTVDAAGNVYLAGDTDSPDYPTTPASLDPSFNSEYDIFVTKINPGGDGILFSTFLSGSSGNEWPGAVAVDNNGQVYVTGETDAPDFPATSGSPSGNNDVFIAKLNSTGSALIYSLLAGGDGADSGRAIALDETGNVYVAGQTTSDNFPALAGGLDGSYNGGETDVFVLKVNPAGNQLLFSSYLGGDSEDLAGPSLALDEAGNIYLAGTTNSADFPITPGTGSYEGAYDGFVVKLDPIENSLLYSRYLGGSGDDGANGLAMGPEGQVYLTGFTESDDFPVSSNALASEFAGQGDVFVVQLDPGGNSLKYSTFLGGNGYDLGGEIALDAEKRLYLAGETNSEDFPTTPNAINPTYQGAFDVFVSQLALPGLVLSKNGPATATAGSPITYTLTVSNTGLVTATNLLITDTLPQSAAYISGGTKVGNVVSWTLPSLAGGEAASVVFVVTSTTTLTNNDYAVRADDGLLARGHIVVTTQISAPVTTNFSAFPLSGSQPLLVQFLNSSVGANQYLWSFGDNLTSTLPSPTHTYITGVYTVTLAASNGVVTQTLTRTHYITATAPISKAWRLVTSTVAPPIVGEQAMAYDSARNRVAIYGGNANGWPYENTIWEFDGTNWLTVTTGVSPAARYGAAMAYDSARQTIVLFGGSNAPDTTLAQTWEYTNSNWVQRFPATSPFSRAYASMVAGPNGSLYLFGGNDGKTYFNDLWRYNNGVWTEITVSGPRPSARTLTAMTYDSSSLAGGTEGGRLLLFGGRAVSGTLLADLWTLSPLTATTWTQLSFANGPSARMAHTLTYNPATGQVILVGGVANTPLPLGDVWLYSEGSWIQTTSLPHSQAYHQTVYDNNTVILFGDKETWRYE